MSEQSGMVLLVVHWTSSDSGMVYFMSCRLNGFGADQLSQTWNELDFFQSGFQVVPKGNPKFAARFLQTGKCILAASI